MFYVTVFWENGTGIRYLLSEQQTDELITKVESRMYYRNGDLKHMIVRGGGGKRCFVLLDGIVGISASPHVPPNISVEKYHQLLERLAKAAEEDLKQRDEGEEWKNQDGDEAD